MKFACHGGLLETEIILAPLLPCHSVARFEAALTPPVAKEEWAGEGRDGW